MTHPFGPLARTLAHRRVRYVLKDKLFLATHFDARQQLLQGFDED